jgi:Flp pilus assembly protein TadG
MCDLRHPGPRHRAATSRRAATAIEFAMMLPILLFFVSAVVDWGWYMTQRVAVARATMDGCRVGATVYEPSSLTAGTLIKPRAENRAKDVLSGMNMPCTAGRCSVTATYCANGAGGKCNNPPFDALVVETQYDFDPFFGFVPIPDDMQEFFLMAVENQR